MSNAPPAERLPPVFLAVAAAGAQIEIAGQLAFLARLGRFRRLQRDLVARAQGDVALAFDVGAFKRQIAACVQLHALLAADVTDLGGAAAVFAAAGAAAEAGAEVLLSAVKPPFAEALTLKPLWFSLCLSLA